MTLKCPPRLPTELLCKIFEQVDKDQELADLWMSYRNVCRTWRDAAESVFRVKHLVKMSIDFHLGESYLKIPRDEDDDNQFDNDSDNDLQRTFLGVLAAFDHLSDDKTVAYFKFEEPHKYALPLIKSIMGEYTDDKMWWHSFLDSEPHHYVQIRRESNDTLIFDLSINWDKCEITCDWRKTVTAFYREDKLYHTLLETWTKEREAWTKSLGDKAARGEISMEAVIQQAVGAFGKGLDECTKKARRARFREYFRKEPELDFSDKDFESMIDMKEEAKILKTIKDMRFMAGFADDSDGDSESEGSEDESNSWVDDDEEVDEEEEGRDGDEDGKKADADTDAD